jgi:hypothetical protein
MKKIIKYKEHEIIITIQDDAVSFFNSLKDITSFITSTTIILQIKGKYTLLRTVKNLLILDEIKKNILESEQIAIDYIDRFINREDELEKLYKELEFTNE